MSTIVSSAIPPVHSPASSDPSLEAGLRAIESHARWKESIDEVPTPEQMVELSAIQEVASSTIAAIDAAGSIPNAQTTELRWQLQMITAVPADKLQRSLRQLREFKEGFGAETRGD
jgi:hypothetical protein